MNRKIVVVALVAAMALTLSGLAWAHEGCADCDGQCVDYPKRAHMPMLTAEQREEVKAKAAELHEQGESPEEVRAAIAEMLKEWGIERPQVSRAALGHMAMLRQLSAEQREQLKARIGELREEEASPQEIREAVGDMLKEWGIQPGVGQRGQQAAPPRWGQQGQPPRWGQQAAPPGWGQPAPPPGWGQPAPPPQWGQQGPPPQWGQQAAPPGWGQQGPPPQWGQQAGPPGWGQQAAPPRWGQQAGPPGWGQQAAPPRWGQQAGPPGWGQQAAPPRWGQQAGPPGWGQQAPPPYWGQQGPPPQWGQQQQGWHGQQGGYGQQAQRPGWQIIMQRLTPEQREEVRGTVKELHEDGASGQEIREAIREMLEGWDIQLPPQNRD